jgi:hypothetical protein
MYNEIVNTYYLVAKNSFAPQIAPGVYQIQTLEDSFIRFSEKIGKYLKKGKYTIVADNFNELQIREFIPT